MKSIKCYFQDNHCHRDDAYLGQMAFSDDNILTWPLVIFQCCLLTGFHVICTHLETQHVKMM